ncbi:AAA family ATPase [Billgrantia kenyensis]|uniref:ATP-binding protein n=1 Tax=Billgrantia kenyensis TaxID=321266 RepID=A0A7V9W0W2_9GAMM|nr:AAA family ATPase [Halomonas kenyensis]MBA2779011.1 ATP-binding protein [Halomonas kenyensis]MCG6660438.1 ATP-binding protein [Halomonas kenyensis]
MKIKKIVLKGVKSFQDSHSIFFDEESSVFTFSGINGAGKSTILKSAWLVQKAHFQKILGSEDYSESVKEDIFRLLNSESSYIELLIAHESQEASIRLKRNENCYYGGELTYENEGLVKDNWNLEDPRNIFLYIDSSNEFSEETVTYDDINISSNSKQKVIIEAIMKPERLFSGIYRQLVTDWLHDRVIPNKPARLVYYHVAGKLFNSLIPLVNLSNYSGNVKPGEFILLGKARKGRKPISYDVREFSSGEKSLLSTLILLCLPKSVGAIIIDEPENHFHESLLLEFISLLHTLTYKGGVLSWTLANNSNGKEINEDWLEKEFSSHDLHQIIISTHSKTLIYKTFSIGKNYIVDGRIKPLDVGSRMIKSPIGVILC